MASAIGFVKRLYTNVYPPTPAKSDGALRFGILGAANIAPMALIGPARSHPEVIIAAVAARDPKKAEAFAKKHGIPIVHKTYEDLIADPSIDCIYNPLPNSHHYPYTLAALKAGKHVLLEKPSVSNAKEAHSLFHHPLLQSPNPPVLLEAFHYAFHPAWSTFLSLIGDPADIHDTEAINTFPAGWFSTDDIRFTYALSGGTLMDFGAYSVHSTRRVFRSEPEDVAEAGYRALPEGADPLCEEAVSATFRFQGGATARVEADLRARGGYWAPSLTWGWPGFGERVVMPTFWVRGRARRVGVAAEGGVEEWVRRVVVMHNYMMPNLYHRIDVVTVTEFRDPAQRGKVVRTKEETEFVKSYKWPDGEGKKGEEWWSTYRYQLEEFVNRVKGREGSGVWIEHEDSVRQMELIDKTYLKMRLPVRPTSEVLE
ncbi:NAD(P)-binding protein [Corynespora cassiicola Philippines]|uniref:D-xylose 1-dehydrogenase (NADP(+), D-xylono-1,5-lactone-forming) n=1 Tax=Corynespora cassiicola Philippines TaxID=1448308 RepID=A0A2T2NXN2_CORCC|nr:NAD(P)-binding protein [Corynespora cassiicola Philippines]